MEFNGLFCHIDALGCMFQLSAISEFWHEKDESDERVKNSF